MGLGTAAPGEGTVVQRYVAIPTCKYEAETYVARVKINLGTIAVCYVNQVSVAVFNADGTQQLLANIAAPVNLGPGDNVLDLAVLNNTGGDLSWDAGTHSIVTDAGGEYAVQFQVAIYPGSV